MRERRDKLVHPAYTKPELLATGPNQLWSWDISKLLRPAKWTYFYLYVILDAFSRHVVGWMVADGESSELAKRLIADACGKQEIEPGKLTIHADRGSSMTSKPVAFLMADLGITKTHSRPHVSDDNPYSESHFRTLKYRPGFPERFGSLQDARSFSQEFFAWYNDEHRHSGRTAAREEAALPSAQAGHDADPRPGPVACRTLPTGLDRAVVEGKEDSVTQQTRGLQNSFRVHLLCQIKTPRF